MLLVAMLTTTLSSVARATEYSFDYSVEGGYEYNDNVNLRDEDEIDIHGGTITAPATFTARSERLESSLTGEVTSAKFDDDDFDSNDQDLQGQTTYQLERGEVEGHAGYKRDSTRTSEFLDTGIIGVRATRVETATAGGSGEYMFTEKHGLLGGIDYSDVVYDSPLYRDYDNISGFAGWRYQWSERTNLRLQGNASKFENDADIRVETENLGVQAGFETEYSEALTALLLVGWVNADTNYSGDSSGPVPEDEDSDVFQMNGRLNYRQPRYDLSVNARSGTRPSGRGNAIENHQLDLNYGYRVTERSRFGLSLVGGTEKALNNNIDNDRDFARARLRLDYRLTQAWYVAGTYTFSYQDRETFDGDAKSNQFNLSLIFNPDRIAWSR